MLFLCVFCLFLPITLVTSTQIRVIKNAILRAGYFSNKSQLINGTCCYCLGTASSHYSAVNCFANNTCQLFLTFPLTYRIETTPGARLYFPQQSLPNDSQCCMPDINYLLSKLRTANRTSANVSNPRDAVIDDQGYLVTVEANANYLDRFNSTSLKRLNHTLLPNSTQYTVTYFNGAYYIAPYIAPLTVINSEDLTMITTISTSTYGIRSILFLNDGQTMVVASFDENSLVFLNRTSIIPIRYNFTFRQSTTFASPVGMWRVNDSFFYVIAYYSGSLYSFSATANHSKWNETFVFPTNGTGRAVRITIDECGRLWFAYQTDTILVYDQTGKQLGNWMIPNSRIFDIKIMDNYLTYVTDQNGQAIRFDPNIQCYI
jgi:hypothetical protein